MVGTSKPRPLLQLGPVKRSHALAPGQRRNPNLKQRSELTREGRQPQLPGSPELQGGPSLRAFVGGQLAGRPPPFAFTELKQENAGAHDA